jgi:predicted NUDIX family phosphoesterase
MLCVASAARVVDGCRPALDSTAMPELVLGVPRDSLPDAAKWHGVRTDCVAAVLEAVARHGHFRPRPEAEVDAAWKQIIPYVVLRDGQRLFLMHRTRAGGDARLFERYSIGVGGHVNPEDGGVDGGLRREWAEEIEADFTPDFEPIGVLNEEDAGVSSVHLGLVYSADANGRPVAIREHEKLSGAFADRAAVAAVADRLEGWSAILFNFMTGGG